MILGEEEKLILFMRYPEAGKTKTRLIPELGPEGAAATHKKMAEHMVDRVYELLSLRPVSFEIRYEGGGKGAMAEWFGPEISYAKQSSGDIGERMADAFQAGFAGGSGRIVIIGTDCPALTADHIGRAFDLLIDHDLVLGPALDGGYYLIGLNKPAPALFKNIAWSTGEVFSQTRKIAAAIGLKTAELEQLADVDRPEDLEHFHNHTNA